VPFGGSLDIAIDELATASLPGGELSFAACSVSTAGGDAVVAVDCSSGTVLRVTGTGGSGFQYPLTVTIAYDVAESVAGVPMGTSSGTVDVQLDPPAAPTAAPDAATVAQGGTVDIPVALILANDTAGAGSLTFTCACLAQPASSGSASTGLVSGQQVLRFAASASFAGEAEVPYTVADGFGQSASSSVVITVTKVDQDAEPPVAVNDELSVRAGASATGNVLRNDVDVAGGDLKLVSVAEAQHGEVTWTPDGQVTYAAAAGASGTDVLLYEVEGTGGARASALLVVQVSGSGTTTTTKTATKATGGSLPTSTTKTAATSTVTKPLAKTGAGVLGQASTGVALVAAGVLALVARRRRPEEAAG
jgi:hypothetical protein